MVSFTKMTDLVSFTASIIMRRNLRAIERIIITPKFARMYNIMYTISGGSNTDWAVICASWLRHQISKLVVKWYNW